MKKTEVKRNSYSQDVNAGNRPLRDKPEVIKPKKVADKGGKQK